MQHRGCERARPRGLPLESYWKTGELKAPVEGSDVGFSGCRVQAAERLGSGDSRFAGLKFFPETPKSVASVSLL